MKKIVLTLLIVFGLYHIKAQETQSPLSAVDAYAKQLGALDSFNVATIADTLTKKFTDKKEKARAIFYWISNNISLDPKAIRSNDNKRSDPVIVIQSRKATATGFANLIQEMCSMANIRCLVVDGYVKNSAEEINNKADEPNHSWNVVQLGQSPESWFYIDAAKASGSLDKKITTFTRHFTSEYFFADTALFNLDHYPDNSAWLLGGNQKSVKEFYALPVISNAAYSYGLSKPLPVNGYIRTTTKKTVGFSFSHNNNSTITGITLIMGEGNRQSKPQAVNFTDNAGVITFNYIFKNDDTFPLRILADGNEMLRRKSN